MATAQKGVSVMLPPEVAHNVQKLVTAGRYRSVDEAVLEAVQRFLRHEQFVLEAGQLHLPTTLLPDYLTAQIVWSDGQCCAYCPELDLATAMDSEEEALTDLAEMAVEYAEDYLEDWDFYAYSPDRGKHLPYILAVAKCTTDVYDTEGVQKVRELFRVERGAST